MLITPPDLSERDLLQWYNHTWVSVLGYEGPRFVNAVSGNLVAHAECPGGVSTPEPSVNVRGHWPKLGAINLAPGFALHMQRMPAKSYRRSLHMDVLFSTLPNSWQVASYLGVPSPGSVTRASAMRGREMSIANALWSPVYPTFHEAINLLVRGEAVTVALSRNIIISESVKGEKLAVYFNGDRVGMSTLFGVFTPSALAPIDPLTLNSINKRLQTL